MTQLTKSLRRSLPRPIQRGDWSVEMDAVGITFRQKRHKARFTVSWEAAWERAMEIAAEERRRLRQQKREAR